MMLTERSFALIAASVLMLVSGIADSRGSIHSYRVWSSGKFVSMELLKAAILFLFGIAMFILALKYMRVLGVGSIEIPVLIWFTVMTVGVALSSGQFFTWRLVDQAVAFSVVLGICWLVVRVK